MAGNQDNGMGAMIELAEKAAVGLSKRLPRWLLIAAVTLLAAGCGGGVLITWLVRVFGRG